MPCFRIDFQNWGLGDGKPVPYVALPWSLRDGTLSVTADAVPALPKGEPRPRGPINTVGDGFPVPYIFGSKPRVLPAYFRLSSTATLNGQPSILSNVDKKISPHKMTHFRLFTGRESVIKNAPNQTTGSIFYLLLCSHFRRFRQRIRLPRRSQQQARLRDQLRAQ